MQNRIVSCVVLLALAILATPRLHAFCLEPKIRVDDEFFVSELVFAGTIVTDQKIGLTPDGSYDGHNFTWRVDRVFRGKARQGDLVHTYSGDDSGRFPLEAEEGHQVRRRFLIFAIHYPAQKGEFAVDNCGNSSPLAKASATIAEIRKLPTRHSGLLYGQMIDSDEGVRIVATGADGNYSTVSGSDGKFSIPVAPGIYAVTATKPDHIYTDFDLAYKHSKAVKVPDGGSAGLAFREKGK
ncbi:MAG: carboxypeptidase-like regulatory domain-containing protein [Acidobacteriaceae bacterium]|jgi:hypothetical protein